MHGAAGIKPEHYDLFFKHLLATVKDRITAINANAWDSSTEEAWMTVRDCMSRILSQPDNAGVGSLAIGGLSLNRWGVICGLASSYACIVTPLRVSGMIGGGNNISLEGSASVWDWIASFHSLGLYEILHIFGFALLDALVVVIFVVDLLGHLLVRRIQVKDVRKVRQSKKLRKASLFGKSIIILRFLGIHESDTFPISDVLFLLSYLLQYQTMIFFGKEVDSYDTILDPSTMVGVHWTWGFGVLRLAAFSRAIYALQCMEMVYTVSRRADESTRMTMRITRLILALAYASHVAACLYVLVARIELGPNAYYDAEHPEKLATSFFPDYTILGKENGMLTNYLRCVHFALANLGGMGNHESIPNSAFECIFTIALNFVGATLYAYTTGHLLSMINPAAARANRFTESAAALTGFMTDVGISSDDQDRFVQGLILMEMVDGGKSSESGSRKDEPYASSPGENAHSPAYPEELINSLPRHLQDELHTLALVDAMKRRERAFRRSSNRFLLALTSSLKQTVTLLPGDYIIREGENVPSQLLIVEEGTLEVIVDGNYIWTFKRGDMISFRWVDFSNAFQLNRQPQGSGRYSPLLLSQSIAYASVRAMDRCKIATGLSSKSEKKDMKKKFQSDWNELEVVLDSAKGKRSSLSTREDNGTKNGGTIITNDTRVRTSIQWDTPVNASKKSRTGKRISLTQTIRQGLENIAMKE